MILIKEFEFDAAHNLINYHGKCERLHGHTYKLVVKLKGKPDHEDMVYDFVDLKRLVKKEVIEEFDHHYINDFIEQPTAENIAMYKWAIVFTILLSVRTVPMTLASPSTTQMPPMLWAPLKKALPTSLGFIL